MPVGRLPDIFVSTRDAAKLLGCGPQNIEAGLRNGSFPIGWAWCSEEADRSGQWNYRIPREALYRALETGNLYGGDETPSTYTECRMHKIWADMKQRCNNPNHKKYHLYGGRGIGYVYEWERFPDFEKWAYENGYREYLTLDRKNPNLGYSSENCFWKNTFCEPALSKFHLFTVNNETHSISEWASIWKIPRSTARNKIYKMEATKRETEGEPDNA